MKTGFWRTNLWERIHLEDLGTGGMTVLKWVVKDWGSPQQIELARHKDRWRAVVDSVMNFQVPQTFGSLASCRPLNFSRTLPQ